MAYTVKQVADMTSVSVRTMHYYDEIGLVKPAYIGDNGYRYYEQEQLLLLQQVLFYRELGFPLGEIQNIMSGEDFDLVAALATHKSAMIKKREKYNKMIETIELTMSRLRDNEDIWIHEIFSGLD